MEHKSKIPRRSSSSSRLGSEKKSKPSLLYLNVQRSKSSLSMAPVQRSNSSNSLLPGRSRSRTPLKSLTPLRYEVSKSPLRKADRRPINDKNWQKEQILKIEQLVHSVMPHMKIKPPTINVFVTVCHLLISRIDDDMVNLTMQNYKIEIPNVMKLLKYPGKVSSSLMKCPNTNHEFANVLAIWEFLYDVGEQLQPIATTFSGELDQEKKIANCISNQLNKAYHTTKPIDTSMVNENVQKELGHIYGMNMDELTSIETKLDKMMEKEKNLYSKYLHQKDLLDQHQQQAKFYEESIQNMKEEMIESEDKLNSEFRQLTGLQQQIDAEYESEERQLQELKAKITDFKYNKQEVENMFKAVEEEKNKLILLKDREDRFVEKISSMDLLLSEYKIELERLVFKYNDMMNIHFIPQFENTKSLLLPESGFANPQLLVTMQEYLDSDIFEQNLKILEVELENKKKLRELYCEDLVDKYKKAKSILDSKNCELKELKSEFVTFQRALEGEIGNINKIQIEIEKCDEVPNAFHEIDQACNDMEERSKLLENQRDNIIALHKKFLLEANGIMLETRIKKNNLSNKLNKEKTEWLLTIKENIKILNKHVVKISSDIKKDRQEMSDNE